jgi:hypothetical protein
MAWQGLANSMYPTSGNELLARRLILLCALVVFVTDKVLSKLLCCLLCRAAQGQVFLRADEEERQQLHRAEEPDSPRGGLPGPTLL